MSDEMQKPTGKVPTWGGSTGGVTLLCFYRREVFDHLE